MKITHLSQDKLKDVQPGDDFAQDVLKGLSSPLKSISSKYFYDDQGSQLFQKITQLPEYYPTRKEYEILSRHMDTFPALVEGQELDVIELGVGDGHKTQIILQGFLDAGRKINFYPIDISEKALSLLQRGMVKDENLRTFGIVGDYFDGIEHVRGLSSHPKLVLFLGSNIGNYNQEDALHHLRQINDVLSPSDKALIGFDLKKDIDILNRAYNDSEGYTRLFNLNLLSRMNEELGANFELSQFFHYGVYNPVKGAMESFLVSKSVQDVHFKKFDQMVHFDHLEPIHVEVSFKYSEADIQQLSQQSGFEVVSNFSDSQNYFIDSLWKKT